VATKAFCEVSEILKVDWAPAAIVAEVGEIEAVTFPTANWKVALWLTDPTVPVTVTV